MAIDADLIWIQAAVALYGKSRWWIQQWCATCMVGRRRCVKKQDIEQAITDYLTPKEITFSKHESIIGR